MQWQGGDMERRDMRIMCHEKARATRHVNLVSGHTVEVCNHVVESSGHVHAGATGARLWQAPMPPFAQRPRTKAGG